MRKILTLALVMLSITISSQEVKTALDKVANETCKYFNENKDELESITGEERLVKLGIKMLSLYDKYKEELIKEGIKVDLSDDLSTEKLGESVALSMFKYCPEVLMLIAQDSEIDSEEGETYSITGKIKAIEGNELANIIIEDDFGRTQKFIWLNNFVGSEKLISDKFNIDQKVTVTYKNLEIYSPQLKEYIVKKQIFKIEYLP